MGQTRKQKRKVKKTQKKKPVVNLTLYADYHPETSTQGFGYVNAKKARDTLAQLRKMGADRNYTLQVVNTMYNRAKFHQNRTAGMEAAMKVYEAFLKKFKGAEKAKVKDKAKAKAKAKAKDKVKDKFEEVEEEEAEEEVPIWGESYRWDAKSKKVKIYAGEKKGYVFLRPFQKIMKGEVLKMLEEDLRSPTMRESYSAVEIEKIRKLGEKRVEQFIRQDCRVMAGGKEFRGVSPGMIVKRIIEEIEGYDLINAD